MYLRVAISTIPFVRVKTGPPETTAFRLLVNTVTVEVLSDDTI